MIFDQYQRYKIMQILVNQVKEYYNIEQLNILEVGSNEQLNLEKFLPNENITYSDLIIPNNVENSVNFIKADATDLKDIKDNQFDIVVSLDVFEHILNDKRERFLSETSRVAKLLNIHCFPFECDSIASAELRANEYYKSIFGKDHIWLKEHIDNGLPNIEDLEQALNKLGKSSFMFEHGDILLWEDMMKSLFYTYYVSELTPLRDKIEDFYQLNIFKHDIGEKNYRKFITITDDSNLNAHLNKCIENTFDNKLQQRYLDFLYRNIDDMHSIAQLPIHNEKLEKNIESTFYINNGSGFSEDLKITCGYKITKSSGFIDMHINIPNNTKEIRFDPVEGKACIITGLSIVSSDGILDYKLLNGFNIENYCIFTNNDPQILINLPRVPIEWLKVKASISVFEDVLSITVLSKILSIIEKNEEYSFLDEKLQWKESLIQNLNEKLERKEMLTLNLNKELIKKEYDIKNTYDNLEKQRRNYELALLEKDNLAHRLFMAENSYNVISNSACWKITKPLRIFLDFLKKYKNYNSKNSSKGKLESYKYSFDNFNYENNILNINGWIFNSNKKINKIALILINGNQEYRVNILNGLERKDVYDVHKNENSLYCGFSSKIKLENVNKLLAYLEVDNEDRIFINKIRGSWNKQIEFYKKKLTNQNIKKVLMLLKNKQIKRLRDVTKRLIIEIIDENFNSINLIEFKKDKIVNHLEYSEELYKDTIDIIIPIYNGYEYLEKLFSTISKTKMNYRLIVVNDKSPDERVKDFLNEYSKNNEIILIENEINLGFVKSVNKAFSMAKNNIALLNTDIELPNMWLERLMAPIILNRNVASSTPFTNSGTICSFPDFCKDSVIFEQLDVEVVDEAFQSIKPNYTELPTGVGFCMGINKNVLKKIGGFDDDTFDKGYGEENDWCQRAIKLGYKNVHVENLYVYHKHGGSFLSEQKKKLIERNSTLLAQKHPNYNSDVAHFCSSDPVKDIRNYVIFKILSNKSNGILLYFDHNIGGGATNYLKHEINRNISNNEHTVIVRYDIGIKGYLLNYRYKSYNLSYYCIKLDELMDILNELNIKSIYINELVTYPDLYNTLERIIKIKEEKNSRLVMLLHDYFSVCPTINLLNDKGDFCNIPSKITCEKCLKNNSMNHYFAYENMDKWREKWNIFLEMCDEIVVFSEDSRNLLEKSYGSLDNILVRPHSVNYIVPLNKQYKYTEVLNIGLMGMLNHHKGFNVIKQMLNTIDELGLNINIILLGSTLEEFKHKNFKQTGTYTTDMIPKLALENDIDLFFVSSICPETFSYTTQEIINMGMPIVSFNIGAPAERIRKYNKGLVLSDFDVKNSLNKIIEFSKTFEYKPLKNTKKVLFIAEYISFSSRYRVEHFQEQLLINGIKSDFVIIENAGKCDLNEYEAIVIYRCRYSNKLNRLIEQCHESGKKVFYDIDDYIFDYNNIRNLEFLKDDEYSDFDKYSQNIFKCMETCDGYLTSTENMKEAIKSTFKNKPVHVNRNVASMEMLTISLKAKSEVFKDKEKVIIGYFSGSKTHDNDFKIISSTLLKILKDNKNVYLKIGGCLTLPKEFDEFKQQIEFFEFVDWKRLPYLIASIDINLLPVEDTFFHSCKSENKWTEAALVGVPTVASYNSELARIILDKENGFLCKGEDDWEEALNKLINDYSYRTKIGQNAHKLVLENYITINSGIGAVKFIIDDN